MVYILTVYIIIDCFYLLCYAVMEDFYRFLNFSGQVLWYLLIIYCIYYLIRSHLKNEKRESMTPYELFNDRALEFWLNKEDISVFLINLKSFFDNWYWETNRDSFNAELNYFNKLYKSDLKYWFDKFKEIKNDGSIYKEWDIINIDYVKERIEENNSVVTSKFNKWDSIISWTFFIAIVSFWVFRYAYDGDNFNNILFVLFIILLILFVILWLWFTFIDNYDEDLNRWQKSVKYLFIASIVTAIFSWIVSMIWLPFAVITVILLGILWQLYRMNNKQ